MTGSVFDIKRFSMHDGPGIRTTVFLKGCPLACVWCHNPESQTSAPVLLYQRGMCLRCGLCAGVCPQGALSLDVDGVARDRARCVLCGSCAERCPSEAMSQVGYAIGEEALVAEISKDRPFFDESGGGVTFSGGEPLCQPDFLAAMLGRCRRLGIHCAVDTSGYAERQVMVEIARRADLVLFDVKLIDPRQHLRFTGVSNAGVLDNLRLLSAMGFRMEIRLPIIPGITDTPENLAAAAAFIRALPNVPPVRLLAHHHAAMSKYLRFGIEQRLGEIDEPLPERMEALGKEMRRAGLEVCV